MEEYCKIKLNFRSIEYYKSYNNFKAKAANGVWSFLYIDDVSITNSTDIHEIQSNNSIELEQNYPNPFNSVTNFKYAVATDEFVTLKVYDITGNEICTLVNEKKTAGTYEIAWNASAFRSGIYFSKLSEGNTVISKKLILLRQ